MTSRSGYLLAVLAMIGLIIGCQPKAENPPAKKSAKSGGSPARVATALPSIGEVAREIEGTDIDGVAFKLSDYRGKVVMLDFWGDW